MHDASVRDVVHIRRMRTVRRRDPHRVERGDRVSATRGNRVSRDGAGALHLPLSARRICASWIARRISGKQIRERILGGGRHAFARFRPHDGHCCFRLAVRPEAEQCWFVGLFLGRPKDKSRNFRPWTLSETLRVRRPDRWDLGGDVPRGTTRAYRLAYSPSRWRDARRPAVCVPVRC